MKTTSNNQYAILRSSGFTLVEIMVAVSLSAIVGIGAMGLLTYAGQVSRAGGFQVRFNAMARQSATRITRAVENAKTISVTADTVSLIAPDMKISRIRFDDGGDPGNVHNNRLLLYPDIAQPTKFVVLSTHVSEIPGEAMFGVVPTTPRTARVAYRVGDGTNDTMRAFSRPGRAYQGVEVRVSATPRNLQRWYESL
jgi:prepilin-type N-terminal cleavage/methylation domain-containing protein